MLVLARLPIERCLFSAFGLWDRFVLRGRYVPTDLADAVDFYHRHPSLDDSKDMKVARDEVLTSWSTRVFQSPPCSNIERLQICVDRIEPHEIVALSEIESVVDPNLQYGPRQLNTY